MWTETRLSKKSKWGIHNSAQNRGTKNPSAFNTLASDGAKMRARKRASAHFFTQSGPLHLEALLRGMELLESHSARNLLASDGAKMRHFFIPLVNSTQKGIRGHPGITTTG